MKKLLLSGIIAASTMFSCGTQKNLVSSARIDNTSKTYVDMRIVQQCLDSATNIQYVEDSISHPKNYKYTTNKDGYTIKIYDYLQSPKETDSLKTGDCEDKAIYLQKLLKNKSIYSEIAMGYGSIFDKYGHCWVEFVSNDTTYVLDPIKFPKDSASNPTIYFRGSYEIGSNKKIIPNIPGFVYLKWDYSPQGYKNLIDTNLEEYRKRTGDTLRIANRPYNLKKTSKRVIRRLEKANKK